MQHSAEGVTLSVGKEEESEHTISLWNLAPIPPQRTQVQVWPPLIKDPGIPQC
jgi:hypothetical protein